MVYLVILIFNLKGDMMEDEDNYDWLVDNDQMKRMTNEDEQSPINSPAEGMSNQC